MSTFHYAHIMEKLINQPLLAHAGKAVIIYNALSGRFGTAPMEMPQLHDDDEVIVSLTGPTASRFVGRRVRSGSDGWNELEPYSMEGSTAIIPVLGSLVNRGAWTGSYSGTTSYEGLGFSIDRARADKRVKGVLLDVNSPGGEAVGAFEAADKIRALSAQKEVVAVSNGNMMSAAYLLASGANRIVTTRSGVSGSIGVVMLHMDVSGMAEKMGIKPTVIHAGARKVDGSPLVPLNDESLASLQGDVNRFYELFLSTVAEGRGRRTPVSAARATEGRTYIGEAAKEARLVDDVSTFEAELERLNRRAGGSASGGRKGSSMAREDDDNVITVAEADSRVAAAKAAAVEEGRKAGLEEGKRLGADEERARLRSVMAADGVAGNEAFALELALESPTMSAEKVGQMSKRMAAGGAAGAGQLATREAETGAAAVGGGPSKLPEREQRVGAQPGSGSVTGGTDGWADVVARQNKEFEAQNKGGRK